MCRSHLQHVLPLRSGATPFHSIPFHSHGRCDSHLGRAYCTAQSSRIAALEQFTLYSYKWDGAKWDRAKWDRAKRDRAALVHNSAVSAALSSANDFYSLSSPSAAPRVCARAHAYNTSTRAGAREDPMRRGTPSDGCAGQYPVSILPLREYPTRGCAHCEYPPRSSFRPPLRRPWCSGSTGPPRVLGVLTSAHSRPPVVVRARVLAAGVLGVLTPAHSRPPRRHPSDGAERRLMRQRA